MTHEPGAPQVPAAMRLVGRKLPHQALGPDRAVIDIGSNTVRMVIYAGSRRAPDIWLNEKVTAKLGRELSSSGLLPDKAIDIALEGLARFAMILADIGIGDVTVVATAAVREAANGAQFLDRVRALGLDPQLLAGKEEARISAMGVIGAFPRARGVVADLGGGSLELVQIGDGACHQNASLPLGTLRLPALRERGTAAFRRAMVRELGHADWAGVGGGGELGPLYMVGGTWRALAAFAMHRAKHPLSDPHGLTLDAGEADKVAKRLMRMSPEDLTAIAGISSSRAAGLPDAAAMLRVILRELQPGCLVFSAWGLREGVLFEQLPAAARDQDPLLAGIAAFAGPRGASPAIAAMIAGWTADAASGDGGCAKGAERLRLAATVLALAAGHVEPNLRLRHATDWALDKRWVALGHEGRAIIAACLRAACGKPELIAPLTALADEERLREAAGWGLAIRLCRRIGAGSRISLLTSSLRRRGTSLSLWLDASRAQLATDIVQADLRSLASWLGLEHSIIIGERDKAVVEHEALPTA